MPPSPNVFVDADACPVKEEVYKVARRTRCPVFVVANGAMRVPPEIGKGAVRLSVGRFTTEAEVDQAAEILTRAAGAATTRNNGA